MRILIINTSERTGGAAVAANRLMEALRNNGVKSKMLVRDKLTDNLCVVQHPQQRRLRWTFLWERLVIWLHLRLRRKRLFEIDIANCGADITRLPEFQEADVIHLHWVNQGMLSLKQIRKILDSGKRVVWTMHDIWPATAICHYARGCIRYSTQCQYCTLLPNGGGKHDLAAKTWHKKQQVLSNKHVAFVACSEWLAGEARKSALLKGQIIMSIPNPIDTHVFRPQNKSIARRAIGLPEEGRVILFVSQRVTDERKGVAFLVDAIKQLVCQHEIYKTNTCIAILGGHAEEIANLLALPVHALGYVNDPKRIVEVYNSADVFVLPSLEDNLPNTIMEAMACGVPCVGFEVGGIPEMIDHRKTGYVAHCRDAEDLATGLHWVLDEADYSSLSKACLHKVHSNYSQQSVALKYANVYQNLTNKTRISS